MIQVWVDSLNPEYLENALADVVGDIMGALWGLLRPSQPLRSHAMAAMQLLGKLGERRLAPGSYKHECIHTHIIWN
jgi:transformation/transcription domain-associated protein